MIGPNRNHKAWWAFIGHRLSGIALVLFLPVHFLFLGLALTDPAMLDSALAVADQPLFKAAEWGLVVLLSIHLFFGIRLLVLEFLPWPVSGDARTGLIDWSIGGALALGALFLVGVI